MGSKWHELSAAVCGQKIHFSENEHLCCTGTVSYCIVAKITILVKYQ